MLGSACGSVDEGNPDGGSDAAPVGDFSVAVSPGALTLPIASSTTVTVSIDRNGSVGPVMLATPGLAANLDVAFSQNPVPEGVASVEAIVTAIGGMPASTADVELVASGGGITRTASLSVTTETLTVTGTVRGARQGIRVGIVGKASILSGIDGVFRFVDVVPPYDIYTVADSGLSTNPFPEMNYYKGLTRTDPVVTAGMTYTSSGGIPTFPCGRPPFGGNCPSAPISGRRSGAGVGNTSPILLAWSANRGTSTTINPDNSYALTGEWTTSGNTSQPGNLHGLQFTKKANGAPDQFVGYGRSATTTLTKDTAATIDVVFSPVASSGSVSGTITPLADFPAPQIHLRQQFGAVMHDLWATTTTTTVDASFPVLPNAGGSNVFVSQGNDETYSHSRYVHPLTQSADVSFTMLTPAELVAPLDGTGGITTATPLEWTPTPGAITQVIIGCPRASFYVFTVGTETTIPANADLPLPAGGQCGWSVQTFGPHTDINAAAAAMQLAAASDGDITGPARGWTFSSGRQFTTQ